MDEKVSSNERVYLNESKLGLRPKVVYKKVGLGICFLKGSINSGKGVNLNEASKSNEGMSSNKGLYSNESELGLWPRVEKNCS